MPTKKFIFLAICVLVLINTSIFGTLFIADLITGPSADEIAELKKAKILAAKQRIYDQLPPVEAFKSKANYISSIGEAAFMCESRLKDEVKVPHSSAVNMIESRYLGEAELYKIYIYYETIASAVQAGEKFKVNCVVSGEKRVIEVWKIESV
jgi:hypothetical protein